MIEQLYIFPKENYLLVTTVTNSEALAYLNILIQAYDPSHPLCCQQSVQSSLAKWSHIGGTNLVSSFTYKITCHKT